MKNITYWISAVLSFAILLSCNRAEQPKSKIDYNGIPVTAELVAEDAHYAVFTNVEACDDDSIGIWPPLEQVSLWAYDKQKQKSEMMLLTHLDTDGSRYNTTESFSMPADTIPTIQRVIIISYPEENLKLLVEGSRDYRNVESFVVELGKKDAIYLPTNRGFIGFSEEDNLLIMQSYHYYPCGGRYNRIEAFDCEGKRICFMDAKMEEYANYPSIEELCGMDD